jgi:hypothetical protein
VPVDLRFTWNVISLKPCVREQVQVGAAVTVKPHLQAGHKLTGTAPAITGLQFVVVLQLGG